jgi:medium-chain acyl-[acyl-carrier-protein] hydrolase
VRAPRRHGAAATLRSGSAITSRLAGTRGAPRRSASRQRRSARRARGAADPELPRPGRVGSARTMSMLAGSTRSLPHPTPPAMTAWLMLPRAVPTPSWRLVCLPHAGAGASTFFFWSGALQPAGIEVRAVQYPGRENRLAEPPFDEVHTLVAALADAWPALAGSAVPIAIFGHSMGALLAYELALELTRRGVDPLPQRLFLSGLNAPHLPLRRPRLHDLPEAEFLPAVASCFGNFPAELMNDPHVASVFSGVLRADLRLVERYRRTAAVPLSIPLSVFGGREDPWTSPAELQPWSSCTSAGMQFRLFPGKHFFHQETHARAAIFRALIQDLAGS